MTHRPPADAPADRRPPDVGRTPASPIRRPRTGVARSTAAGGSASFDTPDGCPPHAVGRAIGAARWTTVTVPGNWTLQGVGDLPHYTNVQMPFDGPPPRFPDAIPPACTAATVHRATRLAWAPGRGARRGAESVHAVYVNGRFVGYGTDSRLASEYDITLVCVAGRNDWRSSSSATARTATWRTRTSGGWRACTARSAPRGAPPVHLARWSATPICASRTAPARSRSRPSVGPRPTRPSRAGGAHDRSRRSGPPGGARSRATVPHSFAEPYVFSGHVAATASSSCRVEPWSAESPPAYRCDRRSCDPDGAPSRSTRSSSDFAASRSATGSCWSTGEPIWIFGVNRHDHHPDRGKAVTVDDMRDDLLAMRRHNITAVRSSHYPNDPRFFDLCDESACT